MILKIHKQKQAILLIFVSWFLYILLLPHVYALIGHSYATLIILPIIITALLKGTTWGLFAGIIGLPLNLALFYLFSFKEFNTIMANGIPAWLSSVLIGLIIGKLRDLKNQLREEMETKKNIKNRYEKIVEQAPVILYSFSTKRGNIYSSSQSTAILGYSPRELNNEPYLWNSSIHPDDFDIVNQSIKDFVKGIHFDIEYRIKKADGSWIWLRDRSIKRIESDDEIIIDGIATDITKQKVKEYSLVEKNQEVEHDAHEINNLLEEVNHRIKNNLSLIIGILRIEREENNYSEETNSIVDDVISRIQNIGIVHDVLTKANWETISIFDIIPSIVKAGLNCSPIRDSIKTSYRFTKSEIKITSKIAFKIAIIINELTINTIKYAFKEREKGEIEITIQEPLPRYISITYRDNGPGWPEEVISNTKGSVGTKLIRDLITKDLEGELELFNNKGAEITFQFRI